MEKKNLKTNIFFVLYMNIDNIVKIFQIYIVIKSKLKYYKKTKNTYEKYLAGLFQWWWKRCEEIDLSLYIILYCKVLGFIIR